MDQMGSILVTPILQHWNQEERLRDYEVDSSLYCHRTKSERCIWCLIYLDACGASPGTGTCFYDSLKEQNEKHTFCAINSAYSDRR